MIDRWVASSWLLQLHRGVYAVGHLPRTHDARWWAAVLACGPGAAASHGTAAAAHALLRPHRRIHVTTPAKRARTGIAAHRAAVEVVYVNGLPCTTVARTLIDLASCVPYRVLESAVRQAQVRGLLRFDELGAILDACPRPRGVRRLRAVLGDPVALAPTRSAAERAALRTLADAGLPEPVVNRGVPRVEGVVDLQWPDHRIVVEIDGPTHRTSVQRARDRRRDAALAAHGWRVLRVPEDQVSAVASLLAEALAN